MIMTALAAVGIAGCLTVPPIVVAVGKDTNELSTTTDVTNSAAAVPLEVLRNAPVEIEFNGSALRLEAYVWRNYGAIIGIPDNSQASRDMADAARALTVVVRVIEANGQAIAATVQLDDGWVVLGDTIWEARPIEEQPREVGASSFETMMRGGPKWQDKEYVDVIVRVVDGLGHSQLLASRHQAIHFSV